MHVNGVKTLSHSLRFYRPRGFFCGIGKCSSCFMTVDDIPNIRTCITPLKKDVKVFKQDRVGELSDKKFNEKKRVRIKVDIVIVGSGPAGLMAATSAAKQGVQSILLIDENHLIGVGKETVAAEEGDFSWYQGVKISLFDVTDVLSPKEVDKVEIGDRGTDSPVLRDHKAFLFCRSKNLLVLPILLAEIDEEKYSGGVPPNTHGEYVWQGAYVYDISSEQGLVLRGRITHLKDNEELLKSGFYFESSYAIKRSFYIDNILYTLSENTIKMNDIENLAEINKIDLS